MRYGGAASGVVLIALLLAAALPATRNLLDDQRAEIDGGQVMYEIAVSIVLLIAIPEEFAFRGVLLGSAVSLGRERQATLPVVVDYCFAGNPALPAAADTFADWPGGAVPPAAPSGVAIAAGDVGRSPDQR